VSGRRLMRKRHLEMLLEQLEDIPAPNVRIEQYTTPASLAAELIFFAFLNGDIAEKTVFDFGCGNGILGIAAKMLGAKRVVCVDIDENALEIARRNAQKLGVEVELVHSDVRDFNEKGDTVVMNPPFGAQIANRHADRVFVERALDAANVVYSIHNARSDLSAFLPECVSVECYSAVFPLKRRFWFHKKEKKKIMVKICRMTRRSREAKQREEA